MRHKRILPVLFTLAVVVLSLAPAAGAQNPSMPAFALPSWSDVLWRDASNNLTIQTADIDGDNDAELFGRSSTQIEVYDFNNQYGQWAPLPSISGSSAPSDAGGWNHASYYSTLQAGDLDGQGGDEIFIRGVTGIESWGYDPSTATWTDQPVPVLGDFTDAGGWGQPQYYSTIQAANLDGQPGDEIFGRGNGGIVAYTYDAGAQQWERLPLLPSQSDANGWDQPQYYSTIQAADLDGQPGEELFGRGYDGISVYKFDPNAQAWDELASLPGPSDPNGWDQPQYYSTLQPANIDGQPGDELIGRGYQGLDAWKYNTNSGAWEGLPELDGGPSDAGGWNKPGYYSTIQPGDIDGDGADEVIGRSAAGVIAWKFGGSGWSTVPGAATDFCDSCGWGLDYHYPTIQTAHTGMNSSDQLLGRGITGVVTYGYQPGPNTWAPVSAQFPPFTGAQAAAYQDINRQLGGSFNSRFDIRQAYGTTAPGTLSNWQNRLPDMSPSNSGIDAVAFGQVKTQLLIELANAQQVAIWFDPTTGYLATFMDQLKVGELMDDTAGVLNYDTQSQAELEMQEMEIVEGILEGLNAFDAVSQPELSEAAALTNSLLGGSFTAALGVNGVDSAITDEVQGTYFQIQQKLQADYNAGLAGNGDVSDQIQSDYGLQSTVAGLISSGAWQEVSDEGRALSGAERNYALGIWQMIIPEIWVAYRIPDTLYDAWCSGNICDWQGPDENWWYMSWNRSFGNCNTIAAWAGPCEIAPSKLRAQLLGQTSAGCQTSWNASCNIGASPADVFLGQNGWEDLPAYTCTDVGWFGAMSCQSLRSPDPRDLLPAPVRLNAGGPTLDVGGVRWIGCSRALACQLATSGGAPLPSARSGIKGVRAPASGAIYRTAWGGRAGKRGSTAFRFEVPAADASYRLRLHFAETRRTKVGRHQFDVNVEGGSKELEAFDVMAAARGRNRAIVREFPVTVNDGSVTIRFLRRAGAPTVSGVELIPVAKAGAPVARSRLRLGAVRERHGRRVNLSGRLRVRGTPRRRLVAIEARARGTRSFETIAVVRTRATGRFAATLTLPVEVAAIRARFAGDRSARPAVSRARRAGAQLVHQTGRADARRHSQKGGH